MKKKLLSTLLILTFLLPAIFQTAILYVHADGWKCDICGEWKDDSVKMCFNCYICEDCATGYCDECLACYLCATELGFHCPQCCENCVDPEYGNFPHCENCMVCEDCSELHETPEGIRCDACIEEMQENEFNILCPNCEEVVIGTLLDDYEMNDNLADCGEHCIQCYEKYVCEECNECTLCSGAEICEYCGICVDCAYSDGYHCGYCDDGCYANVGQCPEGGDHCVNCCEDICENCNTCTLGAEIGYCEVCRLCENCWGHCPVCDECYEEVGQCESEGEHCRICCESEGWICGQCDRCTEALGLEFCEYCGLCEDCCAENSAYYGIKKCILDKETKIEDIDPKKHDSKHHILKYTSSSDECHDVWCAYPGCDYYISDSTPHEFIWKTVEEASLNKDGKRVGYCIYCGTEREEKIPKIDPPEFYFVEQPKDMEALPNTKRIDFYVKIGEVGKDTAPGWGLYTTVSAFPVIDGEKLPQTVKELRDKVYDSEIRVTSYTKYGMSYEKGTGVFPCSIFGTSATGKGKYANYTAQGKKLTWYLAVYDTRGEKITYSEPFTIDWNAKHNEHTIIHVCGPLSPYDKKHFGHLVETDHSAHALQWYDGTYHWAECSVCGGKITYPANHTYSLKSWEGNCTSGVLHYECTYCGHTLDKKTGYDQTKHAYSSDYKYNENKHWHYCVNCNVVNDAEKHDFEKIINKYCNKTIIIYKCKTCGYTHMEHDSGSGHKYTDDGDFNGWYGNSTHHWKICKTCGYVNKHEHTYEHGACTVCGRDIPQMGIIGVMCVHGTELTIQMVDSIQPSDAAKFKAGQWSATWIDEDSGNTVGLGQTFPIDQGDEGHQFRAEVSIIGGEDYNAYMIGPIHTAYQTVKGYAATCASEGLKDHQVCLGCGGKFINGKEVKDVVIPKTNNHTYDNDCDEFCNVCGAQREITHKWSDKYSFTESGHCRECTVCGITSAIEPHQTTVTEIKEGNCEQDGLYNHKCFCGYDQDESVPACGHKWTHADPVPALCVIEGFAEHYYCENCYKMSTDANGTQTVGIKKLLIPFDPDNHLGGEEIGYNENEHYEICACGEHINSGAHTFDENGRCTVCHYKKGSNVKTGGKTLTKHDRVSATCIATGTKAYYTDESGKIYVSKAGVKEVTTEYLIIPVSTKNHVGGGYGHSETQHWINCACGEKLSAANHTFNESKVCTVCGYDMTLSPQGGTAPEEQADGGFPWWIFIIIGAVILACGAIVIIIIKKKKKKEPEE